MIRRQEIGRFIGSDTDAARPGIVCWPNETNLVSKATNRDNAFDISSRSDDEQMNGGNDLDRGEQWSISCFSSVGS
jgi:hypothetical protein